MAVLKQNYINHIALVLDASGSMQNLASQLIKVADNQIAYLAKRSQELDQETRITVYTFNYAHQIDCVIYDKDVLRLPSIAEFYRPTGQTALIDATLKSQADLKHTATIYGDHAFLTFVLTDGQENNSRNRPQALVTELDRLPENWTVAVLVPDQTAKFEAKKFGFPADNIAIWDATTAKGLNEAGETIRKATDQFMQARASGVRGTRSMFSMAPDALNRNTIKAAKLAEVPKSRYQLLTVDKPWPIREWVEEQGRVYSLGTAFYQLVKPELIQAGKQIMVLEKKTGRVYAGVDARNMLGLPDMEVRVRPEANTDFDVFVQSTSVNRKLVPGMKLLLMG